MAPASDSFSGLRQATDGQTTGDEGAASTEALFQYVPAAFTWTELADGIAQPSNRNPQRIHALHACLAAEPSRLQEHEQDVTDDKRSSATAEAAARRQIRNFVARVMAPILEDDEDENEDGADSHGDRTSEQYVAVVHRSRAVADDAVAVLRRVVLDHNGATLCTLCTESASDDEDVQVLASLVAAADADQPWTTRTAATAAGELLRQLRPTLLVLSSSSSTAWIVDGVLNGYVRPLFARGPRPAGLTSAGRKAQYGGSGSGSGSLAARSMDTETRATKPWKYGDLRAVSVFAWVLDESETTLVGRHWSLFTPVLLALVDDADTDVRTRGLVLLRTFVDKLPDGGRLLRQTGLDSVLAHAVLPTLLFLPRLTPEEESLQLLDPAYEALLSIATTTANTTNISSPPNISLLDRILRDGVLAGYFHASEHVRVVEVLLRQSGHVTTAMGLDAVRHLKDLIPLYAAVLTDPFAMRHPPALEAAADALQATLASCWPRLVGDSDSPWQQELTRMLMVCWLNVVEDEGEGEGEGEGGRDCDGLQASLVRTADMLLAVMRAAGVDVEASIGCLVVKEPRLGRLFRVEEC